MSKGKAILIIDDDSRNIFALSAVLRTRNYAVITASSMKDALEKLKSNNEIAVVLLDMMMPDMDGYEAIPLIKEIDQHRHIPILAVTAQAMPGDKERCIAAGADEYISKPVDVDVLLETLQKRM